MRKHHIILIALLLGILILLSLLLIPKTYDVLPFQERTGTQYWQLETGSNIGYTKIKGTGSFKKNPIIFLHGGPGGLVRDYMIEALRPLSQQGHDLYFYDQIGSGHSDRLEDIQEYSVNRHQADLKAIVSIIESEKVILIGHSWGACLALNYLQDDEDDVDRIIVVGPGPILPVNKNLINELAPDSLSLLEPAYSNKEGNEKMYNWRSQLIMKWAYRFNAKLATDQEVDNFFTALNKELSKSCYCEYKEPETFEGGSGYYSHLMTMKSINEGQDKRSDLAGMDTPILILRGQCDNQKWGFVKEYLDLFPNAKLEIIEGVGHYVIKGNKEKYYKLISEFLLEK